MSGLTENIKNDLLSVLSWVEEDPKEILQSVYECMDRTCEKLTQLNIDISNIKGTRTTCYFSMDIAHFLHYAIMVVYFYLCSHWGDKSEGNHHCLGQGNRGTTLQCYR